MSTRFDNATDELKRTTNVPAVSPWTMMGWVYLVAAPAASGCFFSCGNSASTQYFELFVSSTRVLTIWNGTGSVTGSTLALSKWFHLAMVAEGTGAGQLKGYVNGKLDITAAGSASPTMNTVTIGTSVDSADDVNARIAAFKLYDRALSIRQVQEEIWSAHPVDWSKLNSYHLLRNATLSRFDDNGRGRHFAVGGTLTTEADPPGLAWAMPRSRLRPAKRQAAAGGGSIRNPYYYRHLAGAAA